MSRASWRAGVILGLLGLFPYMARAAHHQHNNNNNNNSTTQPSETQPPDDSNESAQPPQNTQLTEDESSQSAAVTALQTAEAKLKQLEADQWTAFQQTPQWLDAHSKLIAAQSALDVAKKSADEALANNPDYQAALAAKKQAVDALAAAHDSDNPDPDTIEPLATASLQASMDLRRIENQVLANNSAVQSAIANLAVAQHNLDVLKAKFQQNLLLDKDYAAAKTDVDSAQQSYNGAHAKVVSDSATP